jgi:hypothetical protein
MKKNVYKTLSATMLAIVICFFCNLTVFAAIEGDNCHASANGKFTFKVQPAITLTSSGDVDLGSICPGCCREYDCCYNPDDPQILFTATGGINCEFVMTRHTSWEETGTSGIYMPLQTFEWDGHEFVTIENPGEPAHFFPDQSQEGMGWMQWVTFICDKFCVDCNTAPGTYHKTIYMEVQYACAE